jgi:carbonic anhydrase
MKMFGKKSFVFAILVLASCSLWMSGCSNKSNAAANDPDVDALLVSNEKFIAGDLTDLTSNSKLANAKLLDTNGQKPKTIIISCSDSRVPPEIIFNKALGEIFVIRVAGNVVDKNQLGSIEYAISKKWNTKTVLMVLGHTKCGAVHTAADEFKKDQNIIFDTNENIGSILAQIKPSVQTAFKNYTGLDRLVEAAVDENVKVMAQKLLDNSTIIKNAVNDGSVILVKYKYELGTGKVEPVL